MAGSIARPIDSSLTFSLRGMAIMVIEFFRVFHPQFDVPASTANIRHQFPVKPILEDQCLGVP